MWSAKDRVKAQWWETARVVTNIGASRPQIGVAYGDNGWVSIPSDRVFDYREAPAALREEAVRVLSRSGPPPLDQRVEHLERTLNEAKWANPPPDAYAPFGSEGWLRFADDAVWVESPDIGLWYCIPNEDFEKGPAYVPTCFLAKEAYNIAKAEYAKWRAEQNPAPTPAIVYPDNDGDFEMALDKALSEMREDAGRPSEWEPQRVAEGMAQFFRNVSRDDKARQLNPAYHVTHNLASIETPEKENTMPKSPTLSNGNSADDYYELTEEDLRLILAQRNIAIPEPEPKSTGAELLDAIWMGGEQAAIGGGSRASLRFLLAQAGEDAKPILESQVAMSIIEVATFSAFLAAWDTELVQSKVGPPERAAKIRKLLALACRRAAATA